MRLDGHLSGTPFPDGELDVVFRLRKFKENGRLLYCSYQLDSNFQLLIFSWRDLENLLTVAAIHFFSVTNWLYLYTTRQSDEGVKTSNWCLACFFNRAGPVENALTTMRWAVFRSRDLTLAWVMVCVSNHSRQIWRPAISLIISSIRVPHRKKNHPVVILKIFT